MVRIWHERGHDGAGTDGGAESGGVRGSVQAVASGTIRYFASFDHMNRIIADSMKLPGVAGNGREGSRCSAAQEDLDLAWHDPER